jgi:DNA-binding transcriptional regulator YhcF (GntR family)
MAPQVKDPKYLEKLAQMNFYGKDGNFSLDNARAIYKWYLKNGLITGNLRKRTYDEFLEHVKSKMRLVKGKTARTSLTQILDEESGDKYEGFKLEVNENDIQNIKPDKRHYNTQVLGPIQKEYLTQRVGEKRVKEYISAVNREKNAMTYLNRLLREKYGIDFHQGHFMPSASSLGGALGGRGASPEPGKLNITQGAQPRANPEALQETGRSFSRLDDFFKWDLETKNIGPLGAKALTPADLFAIEKGADPNQILLARQRNIDLGLDIGDGSNYTEGMLRAYYGDQNFDDYLEQVKEAISRQAMQTGIDPATNKPLSGQEKVDITLMERPMARLRRSSFVQMMNGAIHFISKPRTEQAKDIFELGKSPEFEQATAELMPKVQDPFKAAEEARQRGPKIKGTVELGVSEFFMPPKQ